MSEKRFSTNGYYINDTFCDGRKWLVNEVEAKEIVGVMNNLDMKARERSKALSKLQKRVDQRLSEKSKCDYKKAIIEFCKFMNIDSPLLEVMVDEFVEEVFVYE